MQLLLIVNVRPAPGCPLLDTKSFANVHETQTNNKVELTDEPSMRGVNHLKPHVQLCVF